MKSLEYEIGKLALAGLIVCCLVASGLTAAEGATTSNAPKPATHAVTHSVAVPARRSAEKKPVTSATTAHATYHPASVPTKTVTAHATSTTHYAANKGAARAAYMSSARRTTARASAYSPQHGVTTAHTRYSRPAPVSAMGGWQRLARLHLQPERVQEIQQGLIREGYLQGDPSGLWDTKTHDAMLRYQADHGFPTTGLPEAKSLMKLGLGSHPLPPELDHGPVANGSAAPTQSVFTVTPDAPPAAPADSSSPEASPAQN